MESDSGRELQSATNAPAEIATTVAAQAQQVCPNCSTAMQENRCKLVCPGCGYFLSCSDFY